MGRSTDRTKPGLPIYRNGRLDQAWDIHDRSTLVIGAAHAGGVGVLELDYSAIFGAAVAEQYDDSVVGGVLLFRALTYVMPVFLGGILLLVISRAVNGRWQYGHAARAPAILEQHSKMGVAFRQLAR